MTVNVNSLSLDMVNQGDGTWKTSAPSASKIFQLAFDGSTPLYTSPETAYEGNGYITFYGDGNGNGTLGSNTNFDVVDISDDPLYGTVKGLRNTYYSSGAPVYSFTNQTAYLSHNATKTFHMRMRIKWSGNWEWGSDQLKFCKNKGTNGLSVNLPKFDGDGDAYSTIFPADLPADAFINAVAKEALSAYRLEDDIVNDFGGLGVDANWSPTIGQWYTLDWFSDAGTFGNTDGSIKMWVDGVIYLQAENLDLKVDTSSGLYNNHELGHVWQTGAPTQDIFMEWHNIQMFDTEQTPDY